jgi:hypothetical protein
MEQTDSERHAKARVTRHRSRLAAEGARRVEVTVPSEDANLIRAVAGALRAGGDSAEAIRDALTSHLPTPRARTGGELVAFLRSAPVADVDLDIVRDTSRGRCADVD